MAKFEEEKVINALHPEKAEVGKKYWFADNLRELKKYVEKNDNECVRTLDKINYNNSFPFLCVNAWELLYPYEEPKQRMTNIQLMEWLAKGNGVLMYSNSDYCYSYVTYIKSELNNEVDENIVIRTWDSEEWIEPTVDIYERD